MCGASEEGSRMDPRGHRRVGFWPCWLCGPPLAQALRRKRTDRVGGDRGIRVGPHATPWLRMACVPVHNVRGEVTRALRRFRGVERHLDPVVAALVSIYLDDCGLREGARDAGAGGGEECTVAGVRGVAVIVLVKAAARGRLVEFERRVLVVAAVAINEHFSRFLERRCAWRGGRRGAWLLRRCEVHCGACMWQAGRGGDGRFLGRGGFGVAVFEVLLEAGEDVVDCAVVFEALGVFLYGGRVCFAAGGGAAGALGAECAFFGGVAAVEVGALFLVSLVAGVGGGSDVDSLCVCVAPW